MQNTTKNYLFYTQLLFLLFLYYIQTMHKYNYTSNKSYSQSHQTLPTYTNSSIITQSQLQNIQHRTNLLYSPSSQNINQQLLIKNAERINKWPNNIKNLKNRKDLQKFKKFQKEQLKRRQLDQQQLVYQNIVKQQAVRLANQKIFKNQEKIRGLNSKLLYSDTLKERQKQIELRQQIMLMEKDRDEQQNEQLLRKWIIQEQKQRKKGIDQKQRKKMNGLDLKRQHKQMKKEYIKEMKQELQEGRLLISIDQEKKRQEDRRLIERRERQRGLKAEARLINEQNRLLKMKQMQKQQKQQQKIIEYHNKKDKQNQIRKKKQQQRIMDNDRRIQLLIKMTSKNKTQLSTQQSIYIKQAKQLQAKQNLINTIQKNQISKLKKSYQQSLKYQLQKKLKQKQQSSNQIKKYNDVWANHLHKLQIKQSQNKKFIKQQQLKHQSFLRKQAEQKRRKQQDQYRKQLQLAQLNKANKQLEHANFNSYAQKCIKQWSANGKNVYPILRHLANYKQN